MTAGARSKTPFPFKALARFADNIYRGRELARPSEEYLLRKLLYCERCDARMHGQKGRTAGGADRRVVARLSAR